MKTKLCLAALLAAAGAIGTGIGSVSAEESEFVWRTDLDAARAEAARTGRPMLVVFR